MRLRDLAQSVAILVCLLVATAYLLECSDRVRRASPSDDNWNVAMGDALPAFSLKDTEGNTVSLSDFAGWPVLLVRFATWCPPCKAELAAIQKELLPRFRGKSLAIVAVASGEDAATVRKFVKREGLEFTVLVDEDMSYARTIGGSSIPRSVLADRDHKIQRLMVGFHPRELETLANELESFI